MHRPFFMYCVAMRVVLPPSFSLQANVEAGVIGVVSFTNRTFEAIIPRSIGNEGTQDRASSKAAIRLSLYGNRQFAEDVTVVGVAIKIADARFESETPVFRRVPGWAQNDIGTCLVRC